MAVLLCESRYPCLSGDLHHRLDRLQIEYCRPYCKYVACADSVARIPYYIEQAVRYAISGRPGPVYVDIPGNLVTAIAEDVVFPAQCPPPPRTLAPPESVAAAVGVLSRAKRPLIIVGKGSAYARAEDEVWVALTPSQDGHAHRHVLRHRCDPS